MGETNAYRFSLNGKQELPALSKEEDILNFVTEKLGKMSKNEIVNFMHKEQAYQETAPRDIIEFRYAKSLQIKFSNSLDLYEIFTLFLTAFFTDLR